MNTYDIAVRGVSILQKVSHEDLQNSLKEIRGLVWLNGGGNEDITVSLNNDEYHCDK